MTTDPHPQLTAHLHAASTEMTTFSSTTHSANIPKKISHPAEADLSAVESSKLLPVDMEGPGLTRYMTEQEFQAEEEGEWIAVEEIVDSTVSVSTQIQEIWETVQLQAVWRPMAFVYLYNMFQVPNVAWQSFLQLSLNFAPWVLVCF